MADTRYKVNFKYGVEYYKPEKCVQICQEPPKAGIIITYSLMILRIARVIFKANR